MNRIILLLVLSVLVIVGCDEPDIYPKATPLTPLPTFHASPAPTTIDQHEFFLNPGETITITEGTGKFLFIQYRGEDLNVFYWSCTSNSTSSRSCIYDNGEYRYVIFYWNRETVAYSRGSGITLYGNWHVIDSATPVPTNTPPQ